MIRQALPGPPRHASLHAVPRTYLGPSCRICTPVASQEALLSGTPHHRQASSLSVDLAPPILSSLASLWAAHRDSFWWAVSVCRRVSHPAQNTRIVTLPRPFGLVRTACAPCVGSTLWVSGCHVQHASSLAPMLSLGRLLTCLTKSTGPGLRDRRRLY